MERRIKVSLSSVIALSSLLLLAFVSVTVSLSNEDTEKWIEPKSLSPRLTLEVCKRKCQLEQQQQEEYKQKPDQCIQQCQEKIQEQRERARERGDRGSHENNQIQEEEEEKQGNNPYYFHEQRFQSRFQSEEGHIRVLEKFHRRSQLLKGLKHHRFAVIEANPNTFITPHHLDADAVLVLVRGKATISVIWQEKKDTKRESYNVESRDIITLPAGITFYVINSGNENLQIIKLLHSVNNPGDFQEYFAGGGENKAYYSVFSNEVIEAALNISSEQIERTLKKRGERGVAIIRASEEQLRALSKGATSTSTRKQGGRGSSSSSRSLIKLQSQSPVYSNQFGQMYEASPDDFPQLWYSAVGVVDIKQGGMMVPHYNSRATWVVFVAEGTGAYEMACPHVQGGERTGRREQQQQEEQEGRSGEFRRISGRLTPGGVLVVPGGHPVTFIASQNENLRLFGIAINADNNRRNFLAGKENIMNEVEPEAKELTFNLKRKEAEEFFKKQKQSFFTKAAREGGGRRSTDKNMNNPLFSVLNFAGF